MSRGGAEFAEATGRARATRSLSLLQRFSSGQVETLSKQPQDDDAGEGNDTEDSQVAASNRRSHAAQESAAAARLQRIEDALKQLPEVQERMGTEAAKAIYKLRSSIAEFPNAVFRNCGRRQFRVRGLEKTKSATLWQVLSYELKRIVSLGWQDRLEVAR